MVVYCRAALHCRIVQLNTVQMYRGRRRVLRSSCRAAWPPERCCTQRDDARSTRCCNQFPKHEAAATVNNHSAGMWALPLAGPKGPCVAVALGSKDCPAGTYRAEPGQRVNRCAESTSIRSATHRTLMPGCKLCDVGGPNREHDGTRCCRHVDTRSERHVYTRPRRLTKGYQQM
jgi:hypothetical protein